MVVPSSVLLLLHWLLHATGHHQPHPCWLTEHLAVALRLDRLARTAGKHTTSRRVMHPTDLAPTILYLQNLTYSNFNCPSFARTYTHSILSAQLALELVPELNRRQPTSWPTP